MSRARRLDCGAIGQTFSGISISGYLREQVNLLNEIRGQQEIIANNPFMSVDQKNAAMIPLMKREMAELSAQIQRNKDILRGSALDPGQYEQVVGKMQQMGVRVALLGQQIKAAAFGGSIRADLTAWVSQFGTTAKQVAGVITNTLGTAINGVSQAITGLIFKTTSWKEAFAQAAQAIIGNIIQMLLQWVVSRTIMSVLNMAFGQADEQAVNAQASGAAAAWAPAATSASIASYGAAAGFGLAAYLAALGVGTASAVGMSQAGGAGGFSEGGHTGYSSSDRTVAGVVHANEYVVNASATRRWGMDFLNSLNSNVSRPNYASGGFVGAGTGSPGSTSVRPQVHVALFDDPKKIQKWLDGREGEQIIFDVVNRRRVELGMR